MVELLVHLVRAAFEKMRVGEVLGAGTHTLSAVFTPTDITDCASVQTSVTLTVSKAKQVPIVWPAPASITKGTALGSAWLAWHQILKQPRIQPMCSLYWGPSYTNEEVKRVLDNCKLPYRYCDTDVHQIDEALRLLDAGKILAWFQGASEFGRRALGHRSLLASPWAPYVRENLNDYVKHRESFRPFALSIAEDACSEYFNCSFNGRFMATMATANAKGRELLQGLPEGFLLKGDLVRLHVVTAGANPLLYRLLKKSGEKNPAVF